jgi:taurine dioxygenase
MSAYTFEHAAFPTIGSEVDFDLSCSLDEAQQQALRDLLYEEGVLVFRNQSLSDEAQTRVLGYFGNVLVEEGGHREISADGNLGSGRLLFHADLAFTPEPFKLLSLYGIEVSGEGAATLFANNIKALDTLPPALRARLDSAKATTVIPPSQSERLVAFDNPDFVPQITRPAIIPHPVTGRPLMFIFEQQTSRIEGLPQAESDALLETLFGHLYAPANVYRHEWRNGDLVIWDNIAVQHARSAQSGGVKRRLRRIAVADKTFFQLCPQFPPDDPRIAAWGAGGKLELV